MSQESSTKRQGTALSVVAGEPDLRSNLHRFNRDASAHAQRTQSILSGTRFWVFDPDEALFGPAKFVGYQSMTFSAYEAALEGRTSGSTFDDHLTQVAIRKVLQDDFVEDASLAKRLVAWAESLSGDSVLDGVDQTKWRFLRLPALRSYWAFLANPKLYDVEAALESLDQDTWTTKGKDVRQGDRVLLWRGLKDGKRGIVGLGEILSDPADMTEPPESRRFFVDYPPNNLEPRVWVRLRRSPALPLWLDEDESGVLKLLSVARARGGTAFHVDPDQWHQVMALLGGWEPSHREHETLEALARTTCVPGRGQGFQVSAEVRKVLEAHSMRQAERYFDSLSYEIQDVHLHKPYDLVCTKDGQELRVEVKGTQTQGTEVLLTPNEVRHAQENDQRVALYVLHSVEVIEGPDGLVAQGGVERVLIPWRIDDEALVPLGFSYELPSEEA